jgi:4-hydroxy-4-methyl-2-oxoglutarate aldolase
MTLEDVAATLIELGAATLGESGGVPMAPRIRAAWPGACLAAPAHTVNCGPGDNLAVHVAVANAPSGRALVVSASAVPDRGYWGEVLTTAAQARGLTGLIIDGGVRDVAALRARGFPVFSSLIALRGATKVGPGTVGEEVMVGEVSVRTGDWVVADADGVTAIAADRLDGVLAAGEARAAKERGLFRELAAGRTTIELLSLDPGRVRGPNGSCS